MVAKVAGPVEIILAIYKAAETGRAVKLPWPPIRRLSQKEVPAVKILGRNVSSDTD